MVLGESETKCSSWAIVGLRDELASVVLDNRAADRKLVYPILLGTGKRFFSDGAPPRELALVGTKAASSGVVISTYRPSGPSAEIS